MMPPPHLPLVYAAVDAEGQKSLLDMAGGADCLQGMAFEVASVSVWNVADVRDCTKWSRVWQVLV